MSKSYLIFKHEFVHAVKRAGFIIMVLAVPLLALLAIGMSKVILDVLKPQFTETLVIGYVDDLDRFQAPLGNGFAKFVRYATKQEATRALIQKEIGEFFTIPADLLPSGTIDRYIIAKEFVTSAKSTAVIKAFLTGSLLRDKVAPEIASFAVSPLALTVTRLTPTGEVASQQNNIWNSIIPAIFALLLMLSLMLGASTLIRGLGEEKESRLVEVLLSSVSIRQLLVAKVLALGAAGLLQVSVWLVSAPLLLNFAVATFGGSIAEVQIPSGFLLLGVIYFVLGYLLFAALAVGVGAISSDGNEAMQIAMFYMMFGFVPLWFAGFMFNYPNSVIWDILSIFPVTAPVQTMLRLGVSDLPLWLIATNITVLILSILGALLLSLKLFKTYMLMYGKRPTLRQIVRSIRNRP